MIAELAARLVLLATRTHHQAKRREVLEVVPRITSTQLLTESPLMTTWSMVTLRFSMQSPKTARQVEAVLGPSSGVRGRDLWAQDMGREDQGLDEQLTAAKECLARHQQFLQGLGLGTEIHLVIGWSPRQPQDGLLLDPELIALLASLNGYVLLDTYVEPDEEE